MLYTSRDLASYHAALGLPPSVVLEFSKLTDKWIGTNGIQWTVDRLKTLYTDLVHYRAGEPLVGTWYAKNKIGLPKGVLSLIFLRSRDRKLGFRYSTLLRFYTRFIHKETTESQIQKFLSGVSAPNVIIPDNIKTGVVQGANYIFGKIMVQPNQPSYISYTPSPGKRVPLINGKTGPEELYYPHQSETINFTKTGKYLRSKYPEIFTQVFSGFNTMVRGNIHPDPSDIDAVGKIGLIQEPGLKLRAVANPNRIYQVALKPLGDAIYEILKNTSWDCTFDQNKAFPIIQQHLQTSQPCHCIDLTGATDYFPLDLQISVLKNVFPNMNQYIDLFEDISRSDWIFKDSTIKWTKGQPLGLYPSFGSFALTHGLLLYYLNDYSHDNAFFILGDDVVILNDTLAAKYIDCLKVIECPVSYSKTITSNVMAEFGGKLIFSDHVEPQLKWRQISDENFIDIVKLLGMRSLRLLRPQQRKVVKLLWDIPDFVGGIGFNPKGLPLEVRYEKYLTLAAKDEGTFLMSYDRKFQNFFNSEVRTPCNRKLSNHWSGHMLPDLDQRSVALVLEHLPHLLQMWGVLGTNLYEVSLDKDVLPIDGGMLTKRTTLLEKLQRKLGI